MVFGDIGLGIGGALGSLIGLAGGFGEGGEDERREVAAIWRRMQQPDFDMRELTAPQLRIVAEYFPEEYRAKLPPDWRTTEDSPEVRLELAKNLDYLGRVRDEGLPLAERIAGIEAAQEIGRTHKGLLESAVEQLQRRGRAGGGLEAALRLGAGQQASELGASLGRGLQREAILNRLRGAEAVAQQGGALRGQDIALSGEQANQMNTLNALISNLITQQERENTARAQQAAWANVQQAQDVENFNRMSEYHAALENINRANALRQQAFGNQATVAQGMSGALGEQARAADARQAAMRDQVMGLTTGLGQAAGGIYGLATAPSPAQTPLNYEEQMGTKQVPWQTYQPFGAYGPTRNWAQPTIFDDEQLGAMFRK